MLYFVLSNWTHFNFGHLLSKFLYGQFHIHLNFPINLDSSFPRSVSFAGVRSLCQTFDLILKLLYTLNKFIINSHKFLQFLLKLFDNSLKLTFLHFLFLQFSHFAFNLFLTVIWCNWVLNWTFNIETIWILSRELEIILTGQRRYWLFCWELE